MKRTVATPAKYLKTGIPDELKDQYGHIDMTEDEKNAREAEEQAEAAAAPKTTRPNLQAMVEALILNDTAKIAAYKTQLEDYYGER